MTLRAENIPLVLKRKNASIQYAEPTAFDRFHEDVISTIDTPSRGAKNPPQSTLRNRNLPQLRSVTASRMRRWIIIALLATATANGAEIFNFRVWGPVLPTNGWTFVAGHFAGDALADIVGYHPADGSVWMGRNTGANFEFELWATVTPAAGWTVRSGDFDGDSLDDLLLYHPNDGSVWVGRNTGGGFVINKWATLSPHAGWSIEVGDFAGTSRSDVLAYHPSDGSVWVGTNTGSSFGFARWATVQPAATAVRHAR